jgi:hypothetical protein
MSQNTKSTSAPSQTVSVRKDIAAHPSIHPTLRPSKRKRPESSITSIVPFSTSNEKLYSLANVSETLQSMPARMTRKRTADIAYVVEDEEQAHKPEAISKPEDHPQPSIETTDKICLCQPDPKIPRPRNGTSPRFLHRFYHACSFAYLYSLRIYTILYRSNKPRYVAFILYRQRHQQSIVAQHPQLPNPEISKIAGELWRAEPDHVKNEWKLLAVVSRFPCTFARMLTSIRGREIPTRSAVSRLSLSASPQK